MNGVDVKRVRCWYPGFCALRDRGGFCSNPRSRCASVNGIPDPPTEAELAKFTWTPDAGEQQ